MIIIKTPYRISFFGGGTDYPIWYNKFRGKTISTSINFYSYLTLSKLSKFFKYNYRIRYYYREEVKQIKNIKHPTIRNALVFKKFNHGLSLNHFGELPAKTGIGSSSAFSVGLLHGIEKLKNKKIKKKKIFKDAIFLEQNLNKETVGSQDQVISTIGGFQVINFSKKNINNKNLNKFKKNINEIEDSCLLVYSGKQRNSYQIAKKNISKINLKRKFYHKLYKIAVEGEKLIKSKNFNIEKFAELVNESWNLKKQTSKNISNLNIDKIFKIAFDFGALGGKLLGAGKSGFILIIAKKNKHKKIKQALKTYTILKPKFEKNGSTIIYEKNK